MSGLVTNVGVGVGPDDRIVGHKNILIPDFIKFKIFNMFGEKGGLRRTAGRKWPG